MSALDLPDVRRTLVGIALATLPFTQAMTVDLRFPLKVYEIVLLLLLALSATELRVRTAPGAKREFAVLIVFVVLVAGLLAYRQLVPISTTTAAGFTSRFGPLGDGLAKLLYLVLAVFAFLVFTFEAYRDPRWYTRVWLWGALACSLYSWYLFGSSLIGWDPLLLPGTVAQRAEVRGRLFIRSGTFEEGNILGLYLLLSVAVALYARRPRMAAYLSATVLTSLSTASFLGLTLFWTGYALLGKSTAVLQWGRVTRAVLFVAAVMTLLVLTGYFETVIVGKLVGPEAVSRINRLDFLLEGLRMFREHLLTGVGLSQYGYNYNSFQYFVSLPGADLHKLIATNVYVELLSELGLVATGVFLLFVAMLFRRTRPPRLAPLRWALLGMLLVWNAYPTYTLINLWAFFGLIVGVSARASLSRAEPSTSLAGAAV